MQRILTTKFCESMESTPGKWCRVLFFDHRSNPLPPPEPDSTATSVLAKGNKKDSPLSQLQLKSRRLALMMKKDEGVTFDDDMD